MSSRAKELRCYVMYTYRAVGAFGEGFEIHLLTSHQNIYKCWNGHHIDLGVFEGYNCFLLLFIFFALDSWPFSLQLANLCPVLDYSLAEHGFNLFRGFIDQKLMNQGGLAEGL